MGAPHEQSALSRVSARVRNPFLCPFPRYYRETESAVRELSVFLRKDPGDDCSIVWTVLVTGKRAILFNACVTWVCLSFSFLLSHIDLTKVANCIINNRC